MLKLSSHTSTPPDRLLSLREKLAQLIFVRIGSNMPPMRTVEQDADRVAQLIERCPIGGLLLFNGGTDTKATLAQLQQLSATPLLVVSDVERGVGQQVRGYTLFPHQMAFDGIGPTAADRVRDFAHALAAECRDVGIHITLGPVADVNTNPKNPIIATRAFGESTERVCELTRAFIEAAESAGLRTTAKHFPGHGSTFGDSHDSLPVVDRSLAALGACELPPFQTAIDAGCSLVMTAHVAYPALDPSGVPATLSPLILRKLLREQMKFDGAVCSDSLLMAGVRDFCANEGEMALASLNAGVDLLLDLDDPEQVIDYLAGCVADGRLDPEVVDAAYERVRALKRSVFASPKVPLPFREGLGGESLASKIARSAISVAGLYEAGSATKEPASQRPATIAFNPAEPVAAVLLKPFQTAIEPHEQPLAAALRERFAQVQYAQLGPDATSADYRAALDIATSTQQLVVAIIVRPAAWHAFGLRPEQNAFLCELITKRTDFVLTSLGVPYVLRDFPQVETQICAYSDVPVSQQVLADLLCGT